MLYRQFGKTGKSVSVLGFGCMRLPLTDPHKPETIDEEKSSALLHRAVEKGINYIDTAYPYHAAVPFTAGQSELFVGSFLKGQMRDKVFLATKLPSWSIQSREDCDKFLNEQLFRLQTDHIDFYLVHAVMHQFWGKLKSARVFEFLDSAIRDGRIRHAGFSFHDDLPLFKEVVDAYNWSFCQIQYNFMDENFQAGLAGLNYAAKKGLGVVVMEPLRGGSLANNVPPSVQKLWDNAPVHRSPAAWAFQHVWNHPEVSVALSGMNEEAQLTENLEIAQKAVPNSLSDAEKALIESVRKEYRSRIKVDCTACKYCMPCPAGVNIPGCFGMLNNLAMFENPDAVKFQYNVFLGQGKASKCVQCGECAPKCPQHIPIPEKLKEVVKVLEQ
ncbi:MAG: aldo/keto reductase [Candidatus Riflebacteria bacterium]|nr:aldo/keto reductase [Candidatus Riflebacteria bacterium]